MATRSLNKDHWRTYFDSISKGLGAREVEIEVGSLELGEQVAAEWIPLNGLSYDPKDDVLAVITEAFEHNIRHPKEIFVEEDMGALLAVEAVDGDGDKQIVRLRAPLATEK